MSVGLFLALVAMAASSAAAMLWTFAIQSDRPRRGLETVSREASFAFGLAAVALLVLTYA